MNCRELNLIIDDYLTGRLAEEDRIRVEQHLADCESCRIRVENDTLLAGLLKRDVVQDPGEKYWDHLEKSILSRTTESYPEITGITDKSEPNIPHRLASYLVPLAASIAIMFLSFSDITNDPDYFRRANLIETNIEAAVSGTENEIYMERYLRSDILGSIIMAPPGSPLRTMSIGRFEEK